MKKRSKFAIVVILLAIAAIYYYVSIPAVNIHSAQTWFFVMTLFVVLIVYYAVRKRVTRVELGTIWQVLSCHPRSSMRKNIRN